MCNCINPTSILSLGRYLDQNPNLNAELPSELGNLSKLTHLCDSDYFKISDNIRFCVTLQIGISDGICRDLSASDLRGTLPASFGKLTNLDTLYNLHMNLMSELFATF